jgi:hypothetical protein
MDSVIVAAVIAFLVGTAGGYVYFSKKRGARCIGCPDAKNCTGSCTGCSHGSKSA